MQISLEVHRRLKAVIKGLQDERQAWWVHWRELADYLLPRRYIWLLSGNEQKRARNRNSFILDSTGTKAARVLAAGMMNGITSPSRPWFKLRLAGRTEEEDHDASVWLEDTARRMLIAMAETNFYQALAVAYLDLAVFGTSATLIYEDFDTVFRCYNSPLGEFYLAQGAQQTVNTVAREFEYKVHQIVERWGLENCSDATKTLWNQGGAALYKTVRIVHIIEPNNDQPGKISKNFEYREFYYEEGAPLGTILGRSGYHECPGIFPRWELTANDSYGSSPAMDALGDIIQLQHETKKKAQGLDKTVSPPMLVDVSLKHQPTALLPNGITYVPGLDNSTGARPAYTMQFPFDMITADIRDVQQRIQNTFHNDLFQMISQLDTVRSATEIDARKEEKLVLLGPVLERFENEALDPAIKRIYSIMQRAGLLLEPPDSIAGEQIEIQYVSILTAAQTAVTAAPTERWVQFIGNLAAIKPEVLNIPDWEELVRDYGRDIGVRAKNMQPKEVSSQLTQQQAQMQQEQQAAITGENLAAGAKQLSDTDVGGGANALQYILGNQ